MLAADVAVERVPLTDLFIHRGVRDHIRSDNGAEFTCKVVREWLAKVGVRTLFIEPGSPWENGYCESFNGRLRDELLAREIFYTLLEATFGDNGERFQWIGLSDATKEERCFRNARMRT
jgi:transposase InsO family protein